MVVSEKNRTRRRGGPSAGFEPTFYHGEHRGFTEMSCSLSDSVSSVSPWWKRTCGSSLGSCPLRLRSYAHGFAPSSSF